MTRYRLLPVLRWERHAPILASCQDYLSRLERYRKIELDPIKPSSVSDESERILARWGGRAQGPLIVLDQRGATLSSEALCKRLERWELEGVSQVTLVVGGAYGTSAPLRAKADLVWSLGPLTLPHRLALLVVCEQLYRVQTMLRQEPYHHA